ncbi:MAG: hypothetical protein ACI4KG_06505 [Oscillospiraceae bacterium]
MGKFCTLVKTAACTAAASLGILTLSGCTNYTKMMNEEPNEYISMASENTMKQMVKGAFGEEYRLMNEAAENGSFNIEFEVEGIKFSGECYINEKDAKSAQTYTLTGSKGTSASVYAFAGKNGMKIGTSGNSGSHIYDLTFETLAEKLAASIFAPGSGTAYELEQSEYDMFLEYAEQLTAAVGESEEVQNKYADIINAYLDEHPPVIEEKVDSDIGGETANANILTYDIPKDDLYTLVEQLVDAALEDYELDEDMAQYYTKEDMKSEIMALFDEFEDCSLKIVYYVNSKTHSLMKSDITFNGVSSGTEGEIYINALYGANPETAEKQSFAMGMNSDETAYSVMVDITYGEDNSVIAITANNGTETMDIASITSTRNGESYNIKLDVPLAEITGTVDGTIKTEKNSFTLTVDKLALVEGAGEISYAPKGVITFTKGGTMPELDTEKEFLDITEEEMDALVENIESDFTAVLEEFAEDSILASSMQDYINKSKIASVNSNAKMCFTALASELTVMAIEGETVNGTVAEGSGCNAVIGNTEKSMSDYLGEDFSGYFYAEIDPEIYSVNYVVWSEEPIADEYKRVITSYEQETLAEQKIFIGCYPLSY